MLQVVDKIVEVPIYKIPGLLTAHHSFRLTKSSNIFELNILFPLPTLTLGHLGAVSTVIR